MNLLEPFPVLVLCWLKKADSLLTSGTQLGLRDLLLPIDRAALEQTQWSHFDPFAAPIKTKLEHAKSEAFLVYGSINKFHNIAPK